MQAKQTKILSSLGHLQVLVCLDILYLATHTVVLRSGMHSTHSALDSWHCSFFCCAFCLCPPSLSVSFHLPLAYHTYVSLKSPHPSSSPPLTHSCDTKHIIMAVCQTLAASFSVWTHDSCLLSFEQIYSCLNWKFFLPEMCDCLHFFLLKQLKPHNEHVTSHILHMFLGVIK